ncbi:hypothetical protein NMG60_11009658 [Bertholletia excelsa]
MSHEYMAPNWIQRHQRQEQVEGEEGNRSSHVDTHLLQNLPSLVVPLPDHDLAELTWENGQLATHGLGGLLANAPIKPTWGRAGDTLEAIVHQAATCHKQCLNHEQNHSPPNVSLTAGSTAGKRVETSENAHRRSGFSKKRVLSDRSACTSASASATFCKDNNTSAMTRASFESPRSLRDKTMDKDSACHDGSEHVEEEQEMKGETRGSHSTRRSRTAAVHNQSERRRRDRINQKMKALQKLVPNASKTDKASMLDEVIDYLKQLQAQVQMMSNARNIPQMVMPLGVQQHIQMSLLARMGVGVGLGLGMGVLDMSSVANTSAQPSPPIIHPPPPSPSFLPSHFMVPPMVSSHSQAQATANAAINNSVSFNNPYCTLLAQSMNMDLYNKMATMYGQQLNQTAQAVSNPALPSHVQGG